MTGPRASCLECGETFPRCEATTGAGAGLSCPACGSGVVRGLPAQPQTDRDTTRCGACGSTFPRSEAVTDVKGELACPDCGDSGALEPIDCRRESND